MEFQFTQLERTFVSVISGNHMAVTRSCEPIRISEVGLWFLVVLWEKKTGGAPNYYLAPHHTYTRRYQI